MGRFQDLFSQPGAQSPFYILGDSMHRAITDAAQHRVVTLSLELQDTLGSLVENFDLMLSRETYDPSELPVRAAIKDFVAEHNTAFKKIKSDLEALKQAYQN